MAHEMFLAEDFYGRANNVYEAIVAIARRARQIGEDQRKEMDEYLNQVEMMEKFQEDEETYDEPVRPHEPVLQFEKPTVLALREMSMEKLEIIRPDLPEEDEFEEKVVEHEAGETAPTFGSKLNLSSDDEESFPSKLNLSDDE